MEPEPIRKCAECGLLAQKPDGVLYLEALERYRTTGELQGAPYNTTEYGYIPYCTAWRWQLNDEYATEEKSGKRGAHVALRIISKERNCGEFFLWHRGFSPKEHTEMKKAVEFEQGKKRNDRIAAKRELREKSRQRRHDNYQKAFFAVVGLLLAIVQAYVVKKLIEGPAPNPVPVVVPAPVVTVNIPPASVPEKK